MSTPPPPPPGFVPPPSQKSAFPWMACGISCLFVVLALGAIVAFIAVKAKRAVDRFQAQIERAEEAGRLERAARDRIASLDELHPPTLGEELSTGELSDADLAQYLGLHAALGESLAAHVAVEQRLREFEERLEGQDGNREPSWKDFKEIMSGAKDAVSAGFDSSTTRAALFEAAASHMESEGIGRTQLRRLCGIIDWQFLGREGFEELALSAEDWSDLETARAQVELWGEDDFDPEYWERDEWEAFQLKLAAHRETIARLEAQMAGNRPELSETSRIKLESRRFELEAIPRDNALEILELTREEASFEDGTEEAAEEAVGDAGEESVEAPKD